jgi:OOP family OmpA-OmpF porin
MKKSIIPVALLSTLLASTSVCANAAGSVNIGYVIDSSSSIVHDSIGECWHNIVWTPALAVPGCDGFVAKPKAAPVVPKKVAVVKPAPAPVVVPKPAPAAPVVVPAPAPAPVVVVPAPAPVVVAPVPVVVPAPAVEAKSIPAPKIAPPPKESWKTILTEKPVRLEGASFATGSAKLLKSADAKLDEVVNAAKQHPEIKLEVSGYTDSLGKKASNQKLSENRAAAVKAYFVKHGVAADRISSHGYADAEPLADNKTAEGRATNRRVEVRYAITEEKKIRVTE